MGSDRSQVTRQRLADVALGLFEANGYGPTSVNEIAATAGVSHMTFFRYFPKKESVVLEDPYDPAIAQAVAAQPQSLPAIERVALGLLGVSAAMDDAVSVDARRRIVVATAVPELRAAMVENNRATEDAIVEACSPDETDALEMRVAASACLAALSTALMHWANADVDVSLGDVVRAALATVVPGLGGGS